MNKKPDINPVIGTQLTIKSARETSSMTAQQPGRKVKVLKLVWWDVENSAHHSDGLLLLYTAHQLDGLFLRPDICLGADADFTPEDLLGFAKEYFSQQGLRVAVNTPFAGALVPEPFYSLKDKRVHSLMIEVNRSLYMNERTGQKQATFHEIQSILQRFLQKLRKKHIDLSCV